MTADGVGVRPCLWGAGHRSSAVGNLDAGGQRRYVESLSDYARQFRAQMRKLDIDSIEGLSPAISIEQQSGSRNPRSTVGTITEIYDYLRLLWARVGQEAVAWTATLGKDSERGRAVKVMARRAGGRGHRAV